MIAGAAVSIVCKTPGVGGGKSRLRPSLGAELVAALSACFIRDIAEVLDAIPVSVGRQGYAIYSPAGSEDVLRPLLPRDWRLVFRQAATIGEVLAGSTDAFLADGHDCALVVNADSPTLPTAAVEQAIASLRAPGDRLVLGPASDGGYYLIGLKRAHPELFERIAWSTPEVLDRTLDRAAEIGLPVTLLPMWYDIDDMATFAMLEAELAGRPPPFAGQGLIGGPARHTRALLAARMARLPG
ncbi:MAG TPA: TIGR04282 family arsenosugar biosynthesis glycosyltransferase [Falsiroseomonas sp.]|nr:TIGR04282 family arsenosugar biosynthesis glycosyltransferase [Falsiroseomonas sp.]